MYQRHLALRVEFDRIVEQYRHAQEPAERIELLKQAREILNESSMLVRAAQHRVELLTHTQENPSPLHKRKS